MLKYLVIILVVLGAVQWYTSQQKVPEGFTGNAHNQLIMYSLTTCGYCKQKAQELRSAGIRYTEYFIDQDSGKRKELNDKLAKAGFPARGYGTPIFDAYGYMLPNNPSLAKIKSKREGG